MDFLFFMRCCARQSGLWLMKTVMFSVCMKSFLTLHLWKNLLAPRAIGFYVETRKFGSLFFALICFSFDWRLLDSANGPLVSTW